MKKTPGKPCPMSSWCYQLFRQQALAKGYQKYYDIAISCVFTDARNTTIHTPSRYKGLKPFPKGWQELLRNMPFTWLHHNDWFEYVKQNNSSQWSAWLEYVGERYFDFGKGLNILNLNHPDFMFVN